MIEDCAPLVVVPLIGVDSSVRETWHQYIGGAFDEDGEGSAEIISVTRIGVEAEHRGSVVEGELGQRVASEQVAAVIGGIGPEIADDAGGMSGGVDGYEVVAEASFTFGQRGDRVDAALGARIDFCVMSSDRSVVVVGERRHVMSGLIAVVQQDHGNSAEFVDVVVVALDSGRRVDKGVAGLALQEEATCVGGSPK
jgi:hypothetical protein